MPLSPPQPREHIHTRDIICTGYRREDGLWDIEGHLTDTKTYAFTNNERGDIPPGVPVHEMWIRLTVTDSLALLRYVVELPDMPRRRTELSTSGRPADWPQLAQARPGTGWRRRRLHSYRRTAGPGRDDCVSNDLSDQEPRTANERGIVGQAAAPIEHLSRVSQRR